MRNSNNRGCALMAIPIGIAIFFGAFFVIWFNEGRVDLSVLAEDSIPITGESASAESDGELVALSGTIEADGLLGDDPYLKEQPYIKLERHVEMYAWDESGDDEDGYTYRKEWTSSPEDSDNFDVSAGHSNPAMRIQGDDFAVASASIGNFSLLPDQIVFGQVEAVNLTEGMVNRGRVSGNYYYEGSAEPNSSKIGDLRFSYSAYEANQFTTIFGKQEGSSVVTWRDDDNTLIYRGYALDREGGIAALRTEYLTALWGMRMLGLAMFFGGLMMALSPLRRILGYIPILGNVGNMAIAAAAFVVALVVWAITLLIAIILHNIIVLLVVLILAGGAGYYFWSKQDKEKSPKAF